MIQLLKLFIRAGLWLFCSDINIKNKQLLQEKGPLLIIANHPNSFLDAIIIGAQYKRRVYFLARGDAFSKKHHRFFLGLLNMIPIYRQREGKQKLHLNEFAFEKAIQLLKKGEAVLIFIEGICINSHQLQPFKKGTARILEGAQKKDIYPTIHIVAIAYNQLRGIGKKINICIHKMSMQKSILYPKDRIEFNKSVYEILNTNINQPSQKTMFKKTLVYFLHQKFYKWIEKKVADKTKGTVYYDSVLFSLLLFTYPFYLILIFFVLYIIGLALPIIFGILLCILLLSKQAIK